MQNQSLPERPNLRQLKIQAKELLGSFEAHLPSAVAGFRRFHPRFSGDDSAPRLTKAASLSDAQLVLARTYGFGSWTKLKAYVDGVTAGRLNEAVKAGNLETIRSILAARPELVNADEGGSSEYKPVHFAVLQRQRDALKLLLELGADPHRGIYPNRDATTAYIIAKERGYDEELDIIEEADRKRRIELQCTNLTVNLHHEELNARIKEGDLEGCKAILSDEPDLGMACDQKGRSPLHIAAMVLQVPIVEYLLKRWACVRKPDMEGAIPLDLAVLAVKNRNPDQISAFGQVAGLLLTHGSPLTPRAAVALGREGEIRRFLREDMATLVSDTNWLNGGLLSTAVRHGRKDMIELLLDAGWDVNERCHLGNLDAENESSGRPLWDAAAIQDYETVQLLLDHHADPNAMVYASGGPLERAYNNRDEAMKEILRKRGARTSPETIGLFRDNEAAGEFLKETRSEDEIRRLLWAAACGGEPQIVALCLERLPWPPDSPDWYAILIEPLCIWNHGPHNRFNDLDRSTYAECLRLILAHGADPDIEGRFGCRLLHQIMALGKTWNTQVMTEDERVQFATLTIDAGAHFDVRDDLLKSTPLGWACRWGRCEVVDLMVTRGAPINEPDAEPWATPLGWADKGGHREIADLLREKGATN